MNNISAKTGIVISTSCKNDITIVIGDTIGMYDIYHTGICVETKECNVKETIESYVKEAKNYEVGLHLITFASSNVDGVIGERYSCRIYQHKKEAVSHTMSCLKLLNKVKFTNKLRLQIASE